MAAAASWARWVGLIVALSGCTKWTSQPSAHPTAVTEPLVEPKLPGLSLPPLPSVILPGLSEPPQHWAIVSAADPDAAPVLVVGDELGNLHRFVHGRGHALLPAHRGAITRLAVDPEGRLISAGADGRVLRWSRGVEWPTWAYETTRGSITAVAVGATAIVIAAGNVVEVVSLEQPYELLGEHVFSGEIADLEFDRATHELVVSVTILDVEIEYRLEQAPPEQPNWAPILASDVVADSIGSLWWTLDGSTLVAPGCGPARELRVSLETDLLVTAVGDDMLRGLRLWDWRRGEQVVVAAGTGLQSTIPTGEFALSPDGRWLAWTALAAGGSGDRLIIDDLESGARVLEETLTDSFGRSTHLRAGELWFAGWSAPTTLLHLRELALRLIDVPELTTREHGEYPLIGMVVTGPGGAWLSKQDGLTSLRSRSDDRSVRAPAGLRTIATAVGNDRTVARILVGSDPVSAQREVEIVRPVGEPWRGEIDEDVVWIAVLEDAVALASVAGGIELRGHDGTLRDHIATAPIRGLGTLPSQPGMLAIVDDGGLVLVRSSDHHQLRMQVCGLLDTRSAHAGAPRSSAGVVGVWTDENGRVCEAFADSELGVRGADGEPMLSDDPAMFARFFAGSR